MTIRLSFATILLFALLLSTPAYAEETDANQSQDLGEVSENYDDNDILASEEEENEDEDDFFNFLDLPHEYISESVEGIAQGMDLFFADETVYAEATSSYARLSTQINFNNDGSSTTKGDIRLKIDLKKTKKKLKLLLESDTDRDLQTGTDQSKIFRQKNETVSFYAALQKEISKKHGWKTKASLGIKLRAPLDPFLRIRTH